MMVVQLAVPWAVLAFLLAVPLGCWAARWVAHLVVPSVALSADPMAGQWVAHLVAPSVAPSADLMAGQWVASKVDKSEHWAVQWAFQWVRWVDLWVVLSG